MPTTAIAIWRARGITFSDRSEDSVRNSCIPPMPSAGRIAIATPMMPMPPIQCSRARHSSRPGGAASRPTRIVDPVVVSPDMLSKKALAKPSASEP